MENIVSIDLATQTAPSVTEAVGKNWIEYGTEDFRNTYPQFLIDLYYNSSTHAAIINATSSMIAGEGLLIDEEPDSLDTYVGLTKFIHSCNGKESLHEVVKKLSFDFKLQGAYALNLIWNQERTEVVEIYHVPVEKVRCGKPNDLGVVESYWISSDWSNTRKNPPREVQAFNVNDRTSPSQLIYTGDYSPAMELYYTPDYVASCNWALIDQKVSEFHLSNICNGFSGSYFISFANGVPSMEERMKIEQNLAKKFTGAAASGKFVLTFSDDKTRTPEITPIAVSNADKQYLALQELLVQNILTGHRVTSPMLMGIKNNTGLGNNADELNQAFEVYLNTVIKPFQQHILKTIGKVLNINNINLPLQFIQNKPVTSKFTLEDMKEVMTQDEIREELGLKPLETNEMVDEDEYSKFTEESVLSKLIEEYGEVMGDDYELVDDEVVSDEDEDFDFESTLNELQRVELVGTGRAYPNAEEPDDKHNQDGIDKNYNLYKVRYEYAEQYSKTSRRPFCTAMMRASGNGKVYRKRDIINMGEQVVNKGWGEKGADTYSIWKFKGGGNCGHFWRRKIYRFTLGVATGTDIKDATSIISTAKARSQGFYPEANISEVAESPINMPNRGFKNK